MNCLVTGATGFIGKHLSAALLKQGHFVRGLVRPRPIQQGPIDLRFGDITDARSLGSMFEGIDIVFHCAGLLGKFGIEPEHYYLTNVVGTKNVLRAAAHAGVNKFIFLSSAGVIGPTVGFIGDENSPYRPSNIYEQTKAEAEECVKKSGLDYVIIRPEFVYGEGDSHVLGLFQAIQRKSFYIIGSGNAQMQPTYIGDVVRALLRCLNEEIRNKVYIIAGGSPLPVRQVAGAIAEALGASLPRIAVPLGFACIAAQVSEYCAKLFGFEPLVTLSRVRFFTQDRAFNVEKARKELDFHAEVNFEEGVRRSVRFYRQNDLLT